MQTPSLQNSYWKPGSVNNSNNYKSAAEIDALINQMAGQAATTIWRKTISTILLMIGIHTGGAWLAERLHQPRCS